MMMLSKIICTVVASTVVVAHNYDAYELEMKTLIIGTSDSLVTLPVKVLVALGSNYDVINLSVFDGKSSELQFYNDKQEPKYNSIVLTDAQLGVVHANGTSSTFSSLLSQTNWDMMHEFQKKYKVRSVILSSSYNVDDAIVAVPGLEKGLSDTVQLSFIPDNEFVNQHRSNVKADVKFKIGQVNEFVNVKYYYYPSYLDESDNNINNVKPFMYLNSYENDNITAGNDNWIGAFTREIDGREEMHFMINANHFGHHGFVLADMWFPWLNRGLFIGQRRLLLDTQIDDVFLSTGTYNVEENRPANGNDATYRQSASDIEKLVQFQQNLNKKVLANGSSFVIQMAFNGAGWVNFANVPDSLNPAVKQYRDEFFWVSHTYTHFDLYCPYSDCEKNGITDYETSYREIRENADFAREILFGELSDEEFTNWPHYTSRGIVTPRISGLNNSQAIKAMRDNGIDVAVGDNSRPDLRASNIFHTKQSYKDDLGRSVTINPRYPTRIYYDVSLPIEAETEHNSIYGPHCQGYDKATPVSYPQKCNSSSFKYDRDLTIEDMLSIESYEVVRNLLNYQHDPYMFHQANLRFFERNGKQTCLVCMWVEHMVSYLNNYSEMPVITHKMDVLLKLYQEREARDDCDIRAYAIYNNITGEPISMRITSNKEKCVAKVTKTTSFKSYFHNDTWVRNEENYGTDSTIEVYMNSSPKERVVRFDSIPSKIIDTVPEPAPIESNSSTGFIQPLLSIISSSILCVILI